MGMSWRTLLDLLPVIRQSSCVLLYLSCSLASFFHRVLYGVQYTLVCVSRYTLLRPLLLFALYFSFLAFTYFLISFYFFFFVYCCRLLRRGSMFVISDRQFRNLFRLPDDYHRDRMLDLGAGDGATTALLARMFSQVHVTEMSWPMRRILTARGFM